MRDSGTRGYQGYRGRRGGGRRWLILVLALIILAAAAFLAAQRYIVYDMDGNPVEGAVIQLCDEVTCAFQPTDASGIATFSVEEQKVYDIHVLMAPEGYAPDDSVYKTLDTYSDVNIFLEKAA